MGDPFSAAGTAVGITSLGIQTFQIIHKYYSNVKGYHEDIDSVLRQAEGLRLTLETLHKLSDRLELEDQASSSQLQLALKECEDALYALKRTADKCSVSKQAQGIEVRVREVQKRLLWPYKKETVADLQAKLKMFHINLSLAVQSTGLDNMLRKFDHINPTLAAIQGQTADLKQELATQSGLLSSLHMNVADLALVRHQHHQDLSYDLSQFRVQSLQQHTVMDQKLDLLMTAFTSYQNAAMVTPSFLADSIQLLADVHHHQPPGSLRIRQQRSLHNISNGSGPSCTCRVKKKQSIQRRYWISIFSEKTYRHRPTCPCFAHADHDQTFAAQFTIRTRVIGLCAQAGWQRTRRGGWNSIAPVLRYRAIVPRNTGAFKVLDEGYHAVIRLDRDVSQDELSDVLMKTAIALQRAFHSNASPYDVNEHGDSILSVALAIVGAASARSTHFSDSIRNLVDVCIAPLVLYIAAGDCGMTPAASWVVSMYKKGPPTRNAIYVQREIFQYLTQKSGEWAMNEQIGDRPVFRRMHYDSISAMLKLENMNDWLDEDDPLYLAILRRSEVQLKIYMSKTETTTLVSSLKASKHLAALVMWPAGVEILSRSGLLVSSRVLVDLLWDSANRIHAVGSLHVLIGHMTYVSMEAWCSVNERWWEIYREPRQVQFDAFEVDELQQQASWARTFVVAANKLRSSRVKDLRPGDKSTEQAASTTIYPYHAYGLGKLAAQAAWDAGFQGLNIQCKVSGFSRPMGLTYRSTMDRERDRHGSKTKVNLDSEPPLWCTAIGYRATDERLETFDWFTNHGADPFWIHPVFLTTPAHNLVRDVKLDTMDKADVASLRRVEHLLLSPPRDSCMCFCSRDGCLCVSSAMSMAGAWIGRLYHKRTVLHVIYPYLFGIVNQNKNELWVSAAVLRMMTFDRLGLTHTCCAREYGSRPMSEEARVIHELEQDDNEILESLVAGFQSKWVKYDKPFVTFVNRVWRNQMRKVKEGRQIPKETYQAELLRIGVILKKVDEEESESDSSDDEFDIDWPDDYESEDGREGWYTTDEEVEVGDETEDQAVLWSR